MDTKTQSTSRGRYTNTAVVNRDAGTNQKSSDASDMKTQSKSSARSGSRDLNSGMEILDLEFLLGIIENTDAAANQDITMRKLGFNELIRTHRVHEIDSQSLKVYAMDEDGHFGKDIQVESFKELTERTAASGAKT